MAVVLLEHILGPTWRLKSAETVDEMDKLDERTGLVKLSHN